ncbi:MAG: PAS domain S-box protein [Acetobacteraceae bacterium]|nr:PAS domain S-box protein [Acetobacteraceae bacterium]
MTSWNIGAERLFGYVESEILGRPDEIMFTPEDRGAGKPGEERRHARLDSSVAHERWHIRKAGSRFWTSGGVMPLRNPRAASSPPRSRCRDEKRMGPS